MMGVYTHTHRHSHIHIHTNKCLKTPIQIHKIVASNGSERKGICQPSQPKLNFGTPMAEGEKPLPQAVL